MFGMFVNEFIGALVQLLLFSLIPFIFWLIFGRKKENFFKWIGLKKIKHQGKPWVTLCAIVAATGLYIGITIAVLGFLPEGVTTAGSDFAGKGFIAFPAVLAYGFIRTGLSEEVVFRGFLLKRFAEKFGFVAGNTIQAVLFGLMHGVPFGLATHNIPVAIVMTLLPGAFGWFQGWMNEKRFGGSIVPSWLLHGTINVIVAALSL
ncbi:MAG: CPBP family intramembrane metalloprotease [Lachnospiraceae bacterium]|nr:CPBP family intramembrane metalloprotease [Lachnospiraceae bacterium]